MAMIRMAVVEDEQKHIDRIKAYLEKFRVEKGLAMTVRVYHDGEDITENYQPDYDIILMDIQMQFMDGMTAARKIRERDPEVILIFLTSMAGFAIQGYEVAALDYILKPVSYDMFARKLERAVQMVQREKGYSVVLQGQDGLHKMEVSRILYIEARSHQMIYHTEDGEITVRGRLDDIERDLVSHGFFRSNRGYLVNLSQITAMRDNCCVIGGDMLPVSRARKAELLENLVKIL